jgi:endonuclease YncB( thermonuclease family)
VNKNTLLFKIAGVVVGAGLLYLVFAQVLPSIGEKPTPVTEVFQEIPAQSTATLTPTGAPTSTTEYFPLCLPASSQQVGAINDGIGDVDPENYIVEAYAVRANADVQVWMVAAMIYGSHEVMKDGMGPGVWAMGAEFDRPGPVYSVGPYANEFSSWGDAGASDTSINLDSNEVQDAKVCALENAKSITPIPPTPQNSDFTSPDFSTGNYIGLPGAECIPKNSHQQEATLASVMSGDTIEVIMDGSLYEVAYIGINAPDMTTVLGEFSRSANFEEVLGKELLLIKDVSDTDSSGKLLRYVIADDLFINLYLLREGYAVVGIIEPDIACGSVFHEVEEGARADGKGIWVSVTPTVVSSSPGQTEDPTLSPSIEITTIVYQGVVGDEQPDEYVEIINNGSAVVQLQGWTLENNANNVYYFTPYKIEPGEKCRIYTNEFHPETCGFSFYETISAIWNDSNDCAYLRDKNGNLIAENCY